ncbi:unnamed protein product [Schistosoma mattheei]|uniref:Uncharacterized protein n=1 Tax=Schistosoma mattheei TaxID=31246 RepID=A0AA85BU95_9TREM|nr:unnamed protein product [Schistosoma mattheei]
MNCSHLITYYNEQMNKCGETASGALTRLDYVNLQLHNLIKNNHFIRLIYPKHSYPYTELSISSMVSLSIRLSKFNVPTFHESSTIHIDIYFKNVHSLSLPRIETFNDENINKTILITPKLIDTPYSCCTTSISSSSKYNLHSSYCK